MFYILGRVGGGGLVSRGRLVSGLGLVFGVLGLAVVRNLSNVTGVGISGVVGHSLDTTVGKVDGVRSLGGVTVTGLLLVEVGAGVVIGNGVLVLVDSGGILISGLLVGSGSVRGGVGPLDTSVSGGIGSGGGLVSGLGLVLGVLSLTGVGDLGDVARVGIGGVVAHGLDTAIGKSDGVRAGGGVVVAVLLLVEVGARVVVSDGVLVLVHGGSVVSGLGVFGSGLVGGGGSVGSVVSSNSGDEGSDGDESLHF